MEGVLVEELELLLPQELRLNDPRMRARRRR